MSEEQKRKLSEPKKGIYPEHLRLAAEKRTLKAKEKKTEVKDKKPSPKLNTVIVADKDGKRFCVSKNDPRYLSGELVVWNKGLNFSDEYKNSMSDKIKEINSKLTKQERKALYGKPGDSNPSSLENSLKRYGPCSDAEFENIISKMTERGKNRAIYFRNKYKEQENDKT